MAKIRGNDLLVFFEESGEWKTLAYATTCDVDITAEIMRVGSPDTGKWAKKKKKRLDWTVSSGHLLSDVIQSVDAFKKLVGDNTVRVLVGSVGEHKTAMSPDDYKPDGRYFLEGEALVTRLTIGANRGDMCTLSMSLEGTGPARSEDFDSVIMIEDDLLYESNEKEYDVIADQPEEEKDTREENVIAITPTGDVISDLPMASELLLYVKWIDMDGEEFGSVEKYYTIPKGTESMSIEPYKDYVGKASVKPSGDETYRYIVKRK